MRKDRILLGTLFLSKGSLDGGVPRGGRCHQAGGAREDQDLGKPAGAEWIEGRFWGHRGAGGDLLRRLRLVGTQVRLLAVFQPGTASQGPYQASKERAAEAGRAGRL